MRDGEEEHPRPRRIEEVLGRGRRPCAFDGEIELLLARQARQRRALPAGRVDQAIEPKDRAIAARLASS